MKGRRLFSEKYEKPWEIYGRKARERADKEEREEKERERREREEKELKEREKMEKDREKRENNSKGNKNKKDSQVMESSSSVIKQNKGHICENQSPSESDGEYDEKINETEVSDEVKSFLNAFERYQESLSSEEGNRSKYDYLLLLSNIIFTEELHKKISASSFKELLNIFFSMANLVDRQENRSKKIVDKFLNGETKLVDSLSGREREESAIEDALPKEQYEKINNKMTYAEKLKSSLKEAGNIEIKKTNPSFLNIKIKDQNDVKYVREKISVEIGKTSGVNIVNTVLREKEIKIVCNSDADATTIDNIIKTNDELKEKIKIRNYKDKKLNPRVIIYNVPSNVSKDNLVDTILQQNSFYEEVTILPIFKINKTDYPDKDCVHWVCSVTPNTCKQIITKGKLLINLSCCRVDIYYALTRCFKCMDFFHTKDYCEKTTITCSRCGKDHKHTECESDSLKCINCHNSNKKYKKNYKTDHSCMDKNCPTYRAHQQYLFTKIDFGVS